jgi:hypothetical protein
VANLKSNPAIEINVVDPIVRKGYRFKGDAEVFVEGPRFEALLDFLRSGRVVSPIRSIVLMRVELAEPLVSPAYDQGRSEAEVAAQWEARRDDLRRKRET